MNDMNELKPCPFCGAEAKLVEATWRTITAFWIRCQDCGMNSNERRHCADVVAFWNRRVNPEKEGIK